MNRRTAAYALATFVVASAFGYLLDRSIERAEARDEREMARAALRPYADNLAGAVERHVAQVNGLRAFVQSRRDFATLAREFASFSEGLRGSGSSVRAVEVVRGDQIALIYPMKGNESALHLDLRRDPRPAVRRDFLRAASTDSIVLSDPLPLHQGDSGLIVRQRVQTVYSGRADQVALVLDMRAVLADAGRTPLPTGYAMALLDRSGQVQAASAAPLPAAPESLSVTVRDGNWLLLGGPSDGWAAATGRHRLPLRLAIVAIVLLVTTLVALVSGREARLARAVEARTATLRELVEEHQETIDRQQAAERALAASEERLRLALAASRTTTFTVELPSGRMDWLQDGPSVLGLREANQPTASLGQAMQFVDPRDRTLTTEAFAEACRVPGKGAIEVRTIGVDHVARWIAVTWISQAGDDGAVRRIVGTVTDVTARKELEEQVLHSQKMQALGALAGGVAHDFNNLLTVIVGAGQLARMRVADGSPPEDVQAELDEVLMAGDRATLLTSQLLTFSRRQVVQARHFDAADLVRSMGTMLRRLVGERIRVETELTAERAPLYADQGQVTQVVMNLAVNARDAMPDGGVLRIALKRGGRPIGPPMPDESLRAEQFAVLTVSDTGCGINSAIQSKIFDPFFTTKPVGEGTGLGLSTVYGIVMQLGGTLRVASEEGQGTSIEVYFPVDDGPSVAMPPDRPGAPLPGAIGRTVLIVEDEPGLRQVAERVLKRDGYRVLVASDGVEALSVSRAYAGPIDLLITDVVMPRLGGLELVSRLQMERPGLRILLVSGYARDPVTPAALASLPFLAKPFTPADLLRAAHDAFTPA